MSKKVLNKAFVKRIVYDDEYLESQLCFSSIFKALRGYAPYWHCVRQNLNANLQCFGPPNWFVTLNPSEKNWTELHSAYSSIYNTVVSSSNIYEYIAADPTIAQQHFHNRVRSIFIFLKNTATLGNIKKYFYRIEYQERGAPHVHCMLWTANSPPSRRHCNFENAHCLLTTSTAESNNLLSCFKLMSSSTKPTFLWTEEEYAEYLDFYVTASLPPKETKPTLHKLVVAEQTHKTPCTQTCHRVKYLKKNRKRVSYCRFDFPRPIQNETIVFLNENSSQPSPSTVLGSKTNKITGHLYRQYYLKRNADEININDYNPLLLIAWNGNIDVQLLVDGYKFVADYITNYSTKDLSYSKSLLKSHIKKKIKTNAIMPIAVDLLKRKKMPSTEMVDNLLGHSLYRFDSDHIFVNTNEEHNRRRVLKTAHKISRQTNSSKRAFVTNPYDDYYPHRPNGLKNFCLLNFIINFTFSKKTEKDVKKTTTKKAIEPTEITTIGNSTISNYLSVENLNILLKSEQNSYDSNSDNDDSNSNKNSTSTFSDFGYHTHCPMSPFYDHCHMNKTNKMSLIFSKPYLKNVQLVKRGRQCVPVLYWPRIDLLKQSYFRPKPDDVNEKQNSTEDFYRRLLMLFKPYRKENSFKSCFDATYENAWENFICFHKKNNTVFFQDVMLFMQHQLKIFYVEKMFNRKVSIIISYM